MQRKKQRTKNPDNEQLNTKNPDHGQQSTENPGGGQQRTKVQNHTQQIYTTGEFAEKAHVTIRTIRYYDQKNVLKPSFHTEAGARRYTDGDFAKLQQILLLKYLGFSLDEIREMTIASNDPANLLNSLQIQKRLINERIEQMRAMTTAIDRMTGQLERYEKNPPDERTPISGSQTGERPGEQPVDWSNMLKLIHLTTMEQSMKVQYKDATNVSARIRLHRDYSTNPEGWFPWVYRQSGIDALSRKYQAPAGDAVQLSYDPPRILEIGCGSGALWAENIRRVPPNLQITLSDISEGMLRDARRNINRAYNQSVDALSVPRMFRYRQFDCAHLPFEKNTFDLVIACHTLFYCSDLPQTLSEIRRVLKPGGRLIASTYSEKHMQEITMLVQKYNPEIVLSGEDLWKKFGLENGREILQPFFGGRIRRETYEDSIEISDPEPLIAYILSCHGNQNELLLNRYKKFYDFVSRSVEKGFHITKDVGVFIAEKDDRPKD